MRLNIPQKKSLDETDSVLVMSLDHGVKYVPIKELNDFLARIANSEITHSQEQTLEDAYERAMKVI